MEKTNGEKRYKIEKIESGAKNVVLFEGARAAMSLGLIALGLTAFVVCDTDSIVKNFPVLGGILGYSILAIDFISAMMIVGNIMNLVDLKMARHKAKKLKAQGEETFEFKQLGLNDQRIKDIILNGFFDTEIETTSVVKEKKK